MKAVKNVLSAVAIIALPVIIFSAASARADGVYGVTETAKEILVEVPRFCRPLKVKWEVWWERTDENADLMFSIIERDEKKLRVMSMKPGHYSIETVWRGGGTVHIPKLDKKGKLIKVRLVSILALGDESGIPSKDNWLYESQNSRWVDGAIASPPIQVGTWGKCT